MGKKRKAKNKGQQTAFAPLQSEREEARWQQFLAAERLQARTQAAPGPLREAITELESELYGKGTTPGGWLIADGSGAQNKEFTRQAIRTLCRLSMISYLKNPLLRHGVNLQADHVFAYGVEVMSEDAAANGAIQAFWDDNDNQRAFSSPLALWDLEVALFLTGNLFFVFFDTGTNTQIRQIDFDEIEDVIRDPKDRFKPWFYKRVYLNADGVSETRLYPDIDYPGEPPEEFDSIPVENSRVYHIKTGGMTHMRFGLPEDYPALDWLTANNEFLGDRAGVARALSKFSQEIETDMSSAGAATSAAALEAGRHVTGSTFVGAKGVKYKTVAVQGATINPDEGRRFGIMAMNGIGPFGEHYYCDPASGNLATAKTMELPVRLAMNRRRVGLWGTALKRIARFVCEARNIKNPTIKIEWPSLEDFEIYPMIQAIVLAAPFLDDALLIARQLLTAFKVKDIDEQLKKLEKAFKAKAEAAAALPEPTGAPAP